MPAAYWKQVLAEGLSVPTDRPLGDLTAELTTMLGSPDPATRDRTAYPTLATWVGRGVYDDLLVGLGDGMVGGLEVGLGGAGDDTVFRRSFSALVLGECLDRDNRHQLLTAATVLRWGDHLAGWLLRERDLRAHVPGKGWAHAVAHGADALGILAASRHLTALELTVLLDVVADRVLADTPTLLTSGEPDRLAAAALAVVRRDLVPLTVLEPWVARIAHRASARVPGDEDPALHTGDAQAFLRALYLQLAFGPQPPAVRSDLLLVVVDALRRSNPLFLRAGR